MRDINVRSTGTHGRGETYFDREITRKQYLAKLEKYSKVPLKCKIDELFDM